MSESGQHLEGISPDWFAGLRATILAGDIHVPQLVGSVEYVGAPYHVRFGDRFQGRALAIVDGKRIECPLDNIRKVTLTLDGPLSKADKELRKQMRPGDQVKFVIALSDSELGEWQERKQWCSQFCVDHEAVLSKVQLERKSGPMIKNRAAPRIKLRSPDESLDLFCRNNQLDSSVTEVGQTILREDPT